MSLTFQQKGNSSLKKNPCGLERVRIPQILETRYGKIYDGGLAMRGTDPYKDPWVGLLRGQLWTWDGKNIEIMLNGQPPYGKDGAKIQLHHRANQPNGPLDELLKTEHNTQHGLFHDDDESLIDRAIFSGSTRAQYDAEIWSKQRGRYWVTRAICHLEQKKFC
ncbi:HNH/ENDO VII family nuclease [Marivita sp.]|uniref:HNH/ENDO VII family nuclease n=1 Tax=Marivita sp. TaxID=2003365 RepID=UPI003A839CB5